MWNTLTIKVYFWSVYLRQYVGYIKFFLKNCYWTIKYLTWISARLSKVKNKNYLVTFSSIKHPSKKSFFLFLFFFFFFFLFLFHLQSLSFSGHFPGPPRDIVKVDNWIDNKEQVTRWDCDQVENSVNQASNFLSNIEK